MLKLLTVLVLISPTPSHAEEKPSHILECPAEITELAVGRLKTAATEPQRDAIRSEIEDQFDCDLD